MTLQVIIGPMFSGKTTELCRRVQRLRTITDNILVINHSSDKRYGAAADTLSHDKTFKCPSIPVEELSHLYDEPQYIAAEHIFINEAQFFKDLFTFCQISKSSSALVLDGADDQPVARKAAAVSVDTRTITEALIPAATTGRTEALIPAATTGRTEALIPAATTY